MAFAAHSLSPAEHKAMLGVGDLPQYQKRNELARRALDRGLVTRADLVSEARRR